MQLSIRRALVPLFLAACAPIASAQFNNQWATFVKDTNRLRNPDGSVATQVTADSEEKDYAWGDLDRDGWIDLVVVRKQPGTAGKLSNQLLMNEGGILVDRTSAFAVDSTVPGDLGFLTPTCDRDVQVVDVNGDQWLDLVTAVTLSNLDPKHISHPRIYINKGAIAGAWQGLRYEESRIPQLVTMPAGLPVAPRFVTVAAGDVTGDGFPDLYFTDHDTISSSYIEQPGTDLDDRLLENDGAGNYTDSLVSRIPLQMLASRFCLSSNIVDMNVDGALDVVRATPMFVNGDRFITYNTPMVIGIFGVQQVVAPVSTPYAMDVGDLNRDGLPDLIVGDDGADYYQLNLGNDPVGVVIWGQRVNYTFVSGSDDGFTGQIRVVDLDGDGWLDTVHASSDAEFEDCGRRAHVYHNLGGVAGSQVVLQEEVEMAGAAGWKGCVGLTDPELQGTFDTAAFDIDNDGDVDLVLGRCAGTTVWINQKVENATVFCLGDGLGTACPCGNSSTTAKKEGCLNSIGVGGRLRTVGTASAFADTLGLFATQVPNGPALYFQGTWAVGVGAGQVFGDGLLCAGGTLVRLGVGFAVNNASVYPRPGIDPAISVQAGLGPGDSRTYQAWYRDAALGFCTPALANLTNGLAITWQN